MLLKISPWILPASLILLSALACGGGSSLQKGHGGHLKTLFPDGVEVRIEFTDSGIVSGGGTGREVRLSRRIQGSFQIVRIAIPKAEAIEGESLEVSGASVKWERPTPEGNIQGEWALGGPIAGEVKCSPADAIRWCERILKGMTITPPG